MCKLSVISYNSVLSLNIIQLLGMMQCLTGWPNAGMWNLFWLSFYCCNFRGNSSEVCSGRGQCLCGTCDCDPIKPGGDPSRRYSGKFCECDDYSCDYFDGALCGGSDRGMCECGVCKCNSRYNGTACECPISEEPCRASNGVGTLYNIT